MRASRGDGAALGQLLDRCLPAVHHAIMGRIAAVFRSKLDEEDVLQVTCLEAFLNISAFRSSDLAGFEGWLRRIAENNLKDAIEELGAAKRPPPGRQVHGDAQDSYLSFWEYLGGTTTSPSRQAARREARDLLQQALAKLPEDYRRVVIGYDLEGGGIERVSQDLGRSPGAVFMLRARAHERLRSMLGSASRVMTDR